MRTTTINLLPTTSYGLPADNYDGSSTDWNGVACPASDYYSGVGGIQTITYYLSDFIGIIRFEATLDTVPDSSAVWFQIGEVSAIDAPLSGNHSMNITGKFSWARASVEMFASGTISKLTLTYHG